MPLLLNGASGFGGYLASGINNVYWLRSRRNNQSGRVPDKQNNAFENRTGTKFAHFHKFKQNFGFVYFQRSIIGNAAG